MILSVFCPGGRVFMGDSRMTADSINLRDAITAVVLRCRRGLQQAAHLALTPAPVASESGGSGQLRSELCIITRWSDRSASHDALLKAN